MKKLVILLLILAVGGLCTYFFTTQVYNSTSYLKSFEKFVVELEQKTKLSDSQYAKIKKEYIDYSDIYFNKYKDKLTDSDKTAIFNLKKRYYTALASIGSEEILNDIKGFVNKTTDFFKVLLEQTKTDYNKSI